MGYRLFTDTDLDEMRQLRRDNLLCTAVEYSLSQTRIAGGEYQSGVPVRIGEYPCTMHTETVTERAEGGTVHTAKRRAVVFASGVRIPPGRRLLITGNRRTEAGACEPFTEYVRVIGTAAPNQHDVSNRVYVDDVPATEQRPPGA